MTGGFIVRAVVKDLQRRIRDPWALLLWMGLPLMVGTMITIATGIERPPTAHLLLVDEDQSVISGALARALEGGVGGNDATRLIDVQSVDRAEGKALIEDGQASALLLVPAGFGDAMLRGEPVELRLTTNPAQTVLPAIIEETLGILIDGAFYARQFLGREIDLVLETMDAGATLQSAQVAAIAAAINDKMRTAGPMLFPPAITIEEVTPVKETRVSVSLLFFPGILLMAMLLTAQGLSAEYWQERDDGTLSRLASSPQPMSAYVTAKFLTASVLLAGVSFFMLAAGFAYHGIASTRFALSAVMLVLSGVALYALLSLIQLLAPNRKGASLLNALIVYPLMMVGGSFFPFEAMPDWLAAIGRLSPNGAMLEQLKRYLLGVQGAAALLTSIGTLAAVIVALHVAITLRQRSVVRG